MVIIFKNQNHDDRRMKIRERYDLVGSEPYTKVCPTFVQNIRYKIEKIHS